MSDVSQNHVLFVCTGNTCRSPMAEGLLKLALKDKPEIKISSAGVSASPGHAASRNTQQVLSSKSASLPEFFSRQLDAHILKEASLIIAMTTSHAGVIRHYFPDAKVHLICDFVAAEESLAGEDLPDPYGMELDAYEEVAEVIELATPGIIKELSS